MLRYLFISTIICTCFSCSKDGSTSTSTITTPIGTTVKLEAVITSGTQIPVVQYFDVQQNAISQTNVPTNWSYTYQTTRNNQNVFLQVTGATVNVSARIFINGALKKEATGTVVSISYP